MTLAFAIRDMVLPPKKVLREAKLSPGERVLDFGCGPGSYSIAAAELVGDEGHVYALDIHPLALKSVHNRARKTGLSNIETIQSSGPTRLPDASVDVVLLMDTFHELDDPDMILREIHRVLVPLGRLCFSDHHMKAHEIVKRVTQGGLFRLATRGRYTFGFVKS
jgi:ubiquinone/menaquinone biosynthesis C-methylase UbiE